MTELTPIVRKMIDDGWNQIRTPNEPTMPRAKRIDAPHTKTAAAPDPGRDAIGLTAIVKEAKTDKKRDLLKPGVHEVKLRCAGMIDGKPWSHDLSGTLVIGPDTESGGTTPYSDLLHSALCSLTENQRRAWLGEVAEGRIPQPDCSGEKSAAVAAELEPATAGYRSAHTGTKRGNVTFTPVVAG